MDSAALMSLTTMCFQCYKHSFPYTNQIRYATLAEYERREKKQKKRLNVLLNLTIYCFLVSHFCISFYIILTFKKMSVEKDADKKIKKNINNNEKT